MQLRIGDTCIHRKWTGFDRPPIPTPVHIEGRIAVGLYRVFDPATGDSYPALSVDLVRDDRVGVAVDLKA